MRRRTKPSGKGKAAGQASWLLAGGSALFRDPGKPPQRQGPTARREDVLPVVELPDWLEPGTIPAVDEDK